MESLIYIVFFAAIIFLVLGVFNPQKSLFWIKDPQKRTQALSFFLYLVLIIVSSLLMPDKPKYARNPTVTSDSIAALASQPVAEEQKVEEQKVEEPQNWIYDTQEDKMTSAKNYFAYTSSTNVANFKFPYNGGSTFDLTIRKNSSGTDVYLNVSSGQFIGSYSADLRVRFDNERPVRYSFNDANDGSSNIVFINSTRKFINKLKKAKTLKIEAEFYQEGNFVIEFNVAGLKWNH